MQDANSQLNRIRAGDRQTVKEVFLACRDGFCKALASEWKLSADQVTELYQESFLAMLENIQLDKIQRIDKGWLPYLKGIGRNLQSGKKRENDKTPIVPGGADLPDVTDDHPVDEKELRLQIVERELNGLDDKCVELIDLRCKKGLSFKEIYIWLNPGSPLKDEPLEKAAAILRAECSRCLKRLSDKVMERLKKMGDETRGKRH